MHLSDPVGMLVKTVMKWVKGLTYPKALLNPGHVKEQTSEAPEC